VETLEMRVQTLLQRITAEEFQKSIEAVRAHYQNQNDFQVDDDYVFDFFSTNFGAGIWYDVLKEGLSEEHYSEMIDLEDNDWEKADTVGALVGDYIAKRIKQNCSKGERYT